ncbi:MAG: hypothetical protein HY597_04515 [Candidatus Omnitrophica bacterium]|nr:hypothetical protein [Candidatus Omnitrophota bacterium]
MASSSAPGSVTTVESQRQFLKVIWWSFLIAITVYWAVARLFAIYGKPYHYTWSSPMAVTILTAGGMATLALGWLWHFATFRPQEILGRLQHEVNRDTQRTLAQFQRGRATAMVILSMACMDAAAIYALLLVFLAPYWHHHFYILLAATALSLILYRLRVFPKLFAFLEQLHQYEAT